MASAELDEHKESCDLDSPDEDLEDASGRESSDLSSLDEDLEACDRDADGDRDLSDSEDADECSEMRKDDKWSRGANGGRSNEGACAEVPAHAGRARTNASFQDNVHLIGKRFPVWEVARRWRKCSRVLKYAACRSLCQLNWHGIFETHTVTTGCGTI